MKKFDCDLFCKRVNELFADARQNEIAKKIGISPSVLSKLCSGNSKAPSADTVLAIAKYFNVSTDWLLGLSDNPTTDKATKSLCKTLGLSDVAIEFLQNDITNQMRSKINFIFENLNEINNLYRKFEKEGTNK